MRLSKREAAPGRRLRSGGSDLGWSIEAEDEIGIRPAKQGKPETFVFTLIHAVSLRGVHAQ